MVDIGWSTETFHNNQGRLSTLTKLYNNKKCIPSTYTAWI